MTSLAKARRALPFLSKTRRLGALFAAGVLTSPFGAAAQERPALLHYDHVFVIVEENKNFDQIMTGPDAPNIQALARTYGQALAFYSEVHPSEANYVALLAGDTFGMHDDDAYYCRPHEKDVFCAGSEEPGYVSHTVSSENLGGQLEAKGLSWKGYYEDLPTPGSNAVVAGEVRSGDGTRLAPLYASKHSGFMNFAKVQRDPLRSEKIVGFDQLDRDLKGGKLPNFALIIPNQCNEMHGVPGPGVPDGCEAGDTAGLIRRGDQEAKRLVEALQATAAWRSAQNVAVVLTFDEGSNKTREGCCGITPGASSNFGGGHIPTIVITNHGPRGVVDRTPYSHYSLLKTLEDVFGVGEHLGHAADPEGVVDMGPLFGEAPR